jgi:hypothetical protein
MDPVLWLLIALGIGFFMYLLYAGQARWFLGVVRNMAFGVAGILGINTMLPSMVPAVGVNIITTLVVGLLGIPGVLFLYVTRWLVG